jgi:co-chaperonin GroES (HSP10)
MVLQATAGVCIIQIIKEKNGALVWTSEQKGKIVRGKVIDVGETGFSDFGAKIPAPCKKGDVVWFLKYEQGYDDAYIDGENYVLALFKDVRVVEK